MKSKMKSAFAIIAVALMVIVAVVPMIGVFTSDSDAEVKSVPSEVADTSPTNTKSTIITLNVKAFLADGTTAAEGYAKIAYGSYSQTSALSSGAVTFKIYEASVSSVTVTIVDGKGVQDTDYAAVTLTDLVKDGTYSATLVAGHLNGTLAFQFKNSSIVMNKANLGGKTISASYAIYDGATATSASQTGTLAMEYDSSGQNPTYNLIGKFTYPNGLAEPYIRVTSFSGVTGVTFDSTADGNFAISNGTATAVAKQDLITVTSGNDINASVKIDPFTLYYTEGETAKTLTFTALDNTMAKAGDKAYFVAIKPTSTTTTIAFTKYAMKLTADNGSDTEETTGYPADSISYTTPKKAFYGRIYMVSTAYTQSGSITAKVAASATSTFDVNATVDSDGYFFKYYGEQTIESGQGAITDIEFENLSVTTSTKFPGKLTLVLSATKESNKYMDYALVAGKLALKAASETNDVAVAGKEIIITGTGLSTFGSLSTNNNAITNNNFSFYATKGVNAVLSVSGATLTGSTSIVVGTGGTDNLGKIYMSTQTATVVVQDALGAAISGATVAMVSVGATSLVPIESIGVFTESAVTKGTYTVEVRGDVSLSQYYLYFSATDHTFAANGSKSATSPTGYNIVAYGAADYKATTATYTVQIQDANGKAIEAKASQITAYHAKVYRNSVGASIFEYDATADKIADDKITFTKSVATLTKNDLYSFIAPADEMSVTTVGTTPVKVIAIIVADATASSAIFDPIIMLTADDGRATVKGAADILEGYLTRLDGVTPIPGISVKLTSNGTTQVGTTQLTQSDGSFKFKVSSEITSTYKLIFSSATTKYEFKESYDVIDLAGEKITAYAPAKDTYLISFVDADGAKIMLNSNTVPAITATTVIDGVSTQTDASKTTTAVSKNTAEYVAAWNSDTSNLSIANYNQEVSGKQVTASFPKHTLTDEELATGEIIITSYQNTYAFVSVDADGNVIGDIKATIYKYNGDQPVETDLNVVTEANPEAYGFGTGTIRLPYYADLSSSEYAFKASDNRGTAIYKFADAIIDIDSVAIVIDSTIAKIKINVKDAAGIVSINPNAVAIWKGATPGPTATLGTGCFTFYGDPSVSYKYDVTAAATYTFEPYSAAVDDTVYARECTLNGALMDADGVVIPFTKSVTITPVLKSTATSKANSATLAVNAKSFDIIVNADDVKSYAIAVQDGDAYKDVYTFSDFSTTYMCADESTILFSAVTANGYDIDATFENMQAYDLENKPIAKKVVDGGIIVDADEIVYYEATVTAAGYSFDKKSLLPVFIANETFLTGSVPYSGKGTGSATIELYLEDNLVKEIKDPAKVKIVDKYYYEATLDLSGYIGETAGLVFDSIIVVYYENGVEVGYAAVDPYTAVNNVVSPTVQVYVAVLDVPSALIARHVSIAQVGNTATVSADGQFIVADDDAIYTDGQYIYTFAGWYVDNEKVSSAPSFTFSLTENVVIVPEYTVKYEKISDANAQVDPEIIIEEITKENTGIDTNVLIIGICAVIVALIAVVYAVIKKE